MRAICSPIQALLVIPMKLRKVHDFGSREGSDDPRSSRLFGGSDEVVDEKNDGEEGDYADS